MISVVIQCAKELQAEFKLSDFEALQIATKIEYNEIISDVFLINKHSPNALEAIGMALGYNPKSFTSISEALSSIAESVANTQEDDENIMFE